MSKAAVACDLNVYSIGLGDLFGFVGKSADKLQRKKAFSYPPEFCLIMLSLT